MSLKSKVRSLVPSFLLSWYHIIIATSGAIRYGFPARKLIVIGVTGTKGKTTTANFVWAALHGGGIKTGLIGTANIRMGDEERLNPYHMTMPGRWHIQKFLADMVKAGCTHVVMEVTSEGIKQWRHRWNDYDLAVFTNLTPEHLQAHGGSFEKYKQTKGKLFALLAKKQSKTFQGKRVATVIIANNDSPHKDYYLNFAADKKITFGLQPGAKVQAEQLQVKTGGTEFTVGRSPFLLRIVGAFNVANALPAIIVAREFGIPDDKIRLGLEQLAVIPGRMEFINEGQPFTVIVDYAHEKESMTVAVEAARSLVQSGGRVIVHLGAEGGGRDKAKRPIMGEIVATKADLAIVGNVDPYEDDPTEICEDIAKAAEAAGMKRNERLFVIEDRRAGIKKALTLAKSGDVVLITGKGAETSIVIGGVRSAWDDRKVVREELKWLR